MDRNFENFVKEIITESEYLERSQADKLKVGVRVVSLVDEAGVREGYEGTVCNHDWIPRYVGVHWDKDIGGHDCDNTCPDRHGRNMKLGRIKIIES